ncbi:hypothetical protein WICMUC_001825 [Wickerhamomyces mucosus]|uniref:J domain-containing protein n=1 Tax=Wickerhamomyces mucosus TaxID=1378264 RepID=A0A9P8PTQ8_9ASCO|nr:hypothetical protein WICMUC_001825 [Wickerhamomyces mucosus]
MSDRDLNELKDSKVDIYDLLELPINATENEIKKSYRRKALIYHPDKNPSLEAVEKFHLIKLSLNVLLKTEYRSKYDRWLRSIEAQKIKSRELDDNRRRMKEELEFAEANKSWNKRKATESSNSYALEIERLREEGLQKRRKMENILNTSTVKQNISGIKENTNDRIVVVKWKVKDGISELLNEDVIEAIMSVFGAIESVKIQSNSTTERYHSGIVIYKDQKSALDAVSYDLDYERSKRWENTSYKRLSGLLREIKMYKIDKDLTNLNKDKLSFEEYKDLTLQKLKYFRRPAGYL